MKNATFRSDGAAGPLRRSAIFACFLRVSACFSEFPDAETGHERKGYAAVPYSGQVGYRPTHCTNPGIIASGSPFLANRSPFLRIAASMLLCGAQTPLEGASAVVCNECKRGAKTQRLCNKMFRSTTKRLRKNIKLIVACEEICTLQISSTKSFRTPKLLTITARTLWVHLYEQISS